MVLKIGNVIAMITGGGRGLGRATANYLMKRGAKVAILDLPNEDENADQPSSDGSIFCPCDVTDTDNIMDAFQMTKNELGRPNVLINCAGISMAKAVYHLAYATPQKLENFESMINTNTIGAFNAIRMFVPQAVQNEPDEDGQKGVIINTSSIAAHEGEYGQVAYSASVAAINAMTLPLSRELCSHGIRVNTVSVGYFQTPLLQKLPSKISNYLIQQTPFPQRFGRPDEFAMTAQTIIENSYLNGEIIRLDAALRPSY